ncbi:MAG: hypothetical protein KGL94_10870 [Acidobacteriota bacterium]|nr:hypothetical protein [Acidobacteriota bacterium]
MKRFADVISRQLDLFARDDLLEEARDAKERYDRAPRDEAEEAFGDYMDVVDATKDALAEMRDAFARTLDGETSEEYEEAFEQAVRKRWRWLA